MKTAWLLLLLLGVGALGGCAVNPATGKSDFVMMSEQQELGMGARYNQEILKQFPRYNDEKLQAYVQRVGERVARSSHRSNLQYHFTVIDSPDINAFALPGGYIYIHRGLIAYLGSEAELAAVLGHEVGHVTARHSVRQQSQASAWNILGQAVAIGTGVGAAGDLANVLGTAFVRGYGRDMELEADGLGAQYLARAGYDPTAMIQVVRVLKNQEDFAREEAARNGQAVQAGGYHGLFDTHPDNDRRLQEVVGPARQLANGQQEVGREVFLRHLEGMPFGDSASAGVRRGQNFYHAELDFTLSYPAGWKILNQPSALLGYPADYPAPLYRFADFNAGWYASRNAAFQSAVSRVSGIPLALDGALIRHGTRTPGSTELAVRSLGKRLDMSDAAIRRALEQGDSPEFADSALYRKVFALAESATGKTLPRAVLPGITLESPKITRKLTTAWFAKRVDERYQRCMARVRKR